MITVNKFNVFKIVTAFLLGLLLIALTACEDQFTDVNTPSDQLVADNLDASLIGQAFAQTQYFGTWGDAGPHQLGRSLFSDIYAQYFQTTHESFDSDRFIEVGRWINGAYGEYYSDAAPQLKLVEDYLNENNLELESAIAKVWKVHFYHRITDYWGPIIYSEFGNGETSVAYDSQEEVYNDFFRLLDEAVTVFDANAGNTQNLFSDHDLVYAGNIDQWKKFANSLRLRLAVRISYVDPARAQQEAEAAFNSGVITDSGDDALMLTNDNSPNPYRIITQWGEFRMSATMESVLQGYNDPRAAEYYTPAEATGEYHGMRNGVPITEKSRSGNNPKGADMGIRWLPASAGGTNYSLVLFKSSEVYFLRAEGALRGWNMGGTAEELYNEGIRHSMLDYTEASEEQVTAYINSQSTPAPFTSKIKPGDPMWDRAPMSDIPVDFDSGGNFERQLEQIITQKWIALYPNSVEAWAERRRTGYPVGYSVLESANQNVSRTELMRRMTFVDSEYSDNNAAVLEAVNLLNGPDNNATRVWWDAKPIADYPTIVE